MAPLHRGRIFDRMERTPRAALLAIALAAAACAPPKSPPYAGTCVAALASIPVGDVKDLALALTPSAIVVALAPDLDLDGDRDAREAELVVTSRDGTVLSQRRLGDLRHPPLAATGTAEVHVFWPGLYDAALLESMDDVLPEALVVHEGVSALFTFPYDVQPAGDVFLLATLEQCSCVAPLGHATHFIRFGPGSRPISTRSMPCTFRDAPRPLRVPGGWLYVDPDRAWTRLDDALAVTEKQPAPYLESCATRIGGPFLVAADAGVVAVCSEEAYELDFSAHARLTGRLKLPREEIVDVVASGGRAIVLSTPLPLTDPPRMCVGALGASPRDCFEAPRYNPVRDHLQPPAVMRAEGGEVVVAFVTGPPGARRLHLHGNRCASPAPSWSPP